MTMIALMMIWSGDAEDDDEDEGEYEDDEDEEVFDLLLHSKPFITCLLSYLRHGQLFSKHSFTKMPLWWWWH